MLRTTVGLRTAKQPREVGCSCSWSGPIVPLVSGENHTAVPDRRRSQPWWFWLFAAGAAGVGSAVGAAADHWWLPAMAGWCLAVMVVLLGPNSGTGRSIVSSRAANWVARVLVCAGTVIATVAAAVTARSMFEVVMAVVLPLVTVLAVVGWRRRFGVIKFVD